MFDNGFPCEPGNTYGESFPNSISRRISSARSDNGTRKASFLCLLSLQINNGHAPDGGVEVKLVPRSHKSRAGADVRQDEKFKQPRRDGVPSSQSRNEGRHLLVRRRRMAASRQLRRSLKRIAFRSSQAAGLLCMMMPCSSRSRILACSNTRRIAG
jgi:hypothetical protein